MMLARLSITFPTTHKQIGPLWCWFPGGWVCVHSRTLWISPMNSPLRLGVSPTARTPTGFPTRDSEALFPHTGTLLHSVSHSPVVPPSLSACKCGAIWSTSCLLATNPLFPGCPTPHQSVWMNVSSLSPWLSSFHILWWSGKSDWFLFLNLLSFFWLYKDAKFINLHLHLGRNSPGST